MRRWVPHPAMSVFLLLTWLVLNETLAPAEMLIGAVLALGLGAVFGRLQPPALRIRNRMRLVRLVLQVALDIVRSNLALLRIIAGGRAHRVTSGFVAIPLTLSNPYALAALACIITATPGTIWVSYRSADGMLLIHVVDLVDERVWIRTITERYERPLREIFE